MRKEQERKNNRTAQKQLTPFSVNQPPLIMEVLQASPTIFFSALSGNLHLTIAIKC